LKTQQTFNFSL